MWDYLCEKYRHSPLNRRPNYRLIPTNIIPLGDEGKEEFNRIYQFIKSQIKRKIVRSGSDAISTDHRMFFGQAYDLRKTGSSTFELCVIHMRGMWRFQFRTPYAEDPNNKPQLSGRNAYDILTKKAKELDIDLVKLAEEGPQHDTKEKVSPLICYAFGEDISDKVFTQVHHIDFHSSHPAGIVNVYPETKPLFEYFYNNRKENPENKCVMNYSWGCCLATFTPYPLWHMGMNALKDTNQRVLDMAARLMMAGRRPLAFNTDGIWYEGEIYHGEGEGLGLGQWGNDHQNCVLRFKAPGAYEFIEDGVYHPVVRGRTRLDQIKPRNEWVWGDIYIRPELVDAYGLDEEIGIINIKEIE